MKRQDSVEDSALTFDFAERVAIVTGAAHGFGRAISSHFAQQGAFVWACDILDEELRETQQLCERQGGRCVARRVDVTREDEVSAFAAEVMGVADRVDILVNNAGGVVGQVGHPIEMVSMEEWNRVVAINLTASFLCMRAVAPTMKQQRYGRIVNISSGAGRSVSLTGIQAYASAKAGQIGLTRQMAYELGPWGITVNNVAPGFVLSNPASERQWETYGERRATRVCARIGAQAPWRRRRYRSWCVVLCLRLCRRVHRSGDQH